MIPKEKWTGKIYNPRIIHGFYNKNIKIEIHILQKESRYITADDTKYHIRIYINTEYNNSICVKWHKKLSRLLSHYDFMSRLLSSIILDLCHGQVIIITEYFLKRDKFVFLTNTLALAFRHLVGDFLYLCFSFSLRNSSSLQSPSLDCFVLRSCHYISSVS